MSSKIKALIITYYWPPAGGSGVQRWLKFVKYLRDFDVEPIIYTVKNPSYPISDHSLEKEIPKNIKTLKLPIFEPLSMLSVFGGNNKSLSAGFLDANPTFFGKISQYIRANYFIPDARKFWIQPSVKFLTKFLNKHHIDVVITTGPPHSMHLIGYELKKKFPIKWISDFRDPWTEIDYFHQLPHTKKTIAKHSQLEKKVIDKSDAVIVVGNTMKEKFLQFKNEIDLITNGFDDQNINFSQGLDTTFSLTHIGMMNSDRNPKILWQALEEICHTNFEFKKALKIKLIGKIDAVVLEDLKVFDDDIVECIPYVNHQEVAKYQSSSQVLLLCINKVPSAKGIVTGKIFEYLQAKRPILAIGPEEGDAAKILADTNAGVIIDFDNKDKLKEELLLLYQKFQNNDLTSHSKEIEQYHRRNLTEQLASVIKRTLS